ncbi:PR domain zinc finger protein 13-like [Acanthaster planci]|uniref:PR domain zinc finger protein 13-like n=1 Tax=Acanthaster planci TaxID=133434 RepID=A0A8B7ZQC3_ACAPL|nr:PR domain zinc finger protein 13-like [Acanthaster planci]
MKPSKVPLQLRLGFQEGTPMIESGSGPSVVVVAASAAAAATTRLRGMFPVVDLPHASPMLGRAGSAKGSDIETSVWTSTEIPADVSFGPFDGEFRLGAAMKDCRDSPYMLEVKYSEGRLVSGPDSHPTRWMRFVAAAHDDHEQNLSAVRSPEGRVMFRTNRSILRGEELLVWYTNAFAEYLGMPLAVNHYRGKDGFSCPKCPKIYRYPNTLKSHLHFRCTGASAVCESSAPSCRSSSSKEERSLCAGSAFHRIVSTSSSSGAGESVPSSPRVTSANGHHQHHTSHHSNSHGVPAEASRTAMMDIYSLARSALSVGAGRKMHQPAGLIGDGAGSAFRPHNPRLQPTDAGVPHQKEKEGFRVVRSSKDSHGLSLLPTSSSSSTSPSSSSTSRHGQGERKASFTVEKMFGLPRPASPQLAHHNSAIEDSLLQQRQKALERNCLPAGYQPCPVSAHHHHHHGDTPVAIGPLHRSLDPYAGFPYPFYHHHHHSQPGLHPGLSRYGTVLPVHTNGELYGSSGPCFSYKLPFPAGLLRYPDPTAPLVASAASDVMELNKYANLERSLTNQGVTGFHDPQLFANHHPAPNGKAKRGHLCIYCGKLYSRKYGLKIHLRTHTGYKPLKCKVCLRPFGDPSNLNKHIRLHAEGETPYRCQYCGKVLVRRRDLDRHIRSRHPNEHEKSDQEAASSGLVRTSPPPTKAAIEGAIKTPEYGVENPMSSPDPVDNDDEDDEEVEDGDDEQEMDDDMQPEIDV